MCPTLVPELFSGTGVGILTFHLSAFDLNSPLVSAMDGLCCSWQNAGLLCLAQNDRVRDSREMLGPFQDEFKRKLF